jgi:signal transduction histidine kinase
VDDDRGVRVSAGLAVALALTQGGLVATTAVALRQRRTVHHLRAERVAVARRVALSDELALRARRDAETASAGVFELLSGLVAAEEGARGQLAAELHDTVAQSLMLARGLLTDGLPDPADARLLADAVEDAEEQVRAVMARTRPPALRDGDLARAVADLQTELRERYGLRVEVRWPSAPYPLPAASAVIVYRFFQEALHNVVKHADVDDARLVLEVDATSVQARVSDDGPGFDPASVRPDRGRHVGLGLLRERARLAGGSVDVQSRPGAGTTLALRLPRPVVAVPQQRQPLDDLAVALDA